MQQQLGPQMNARLAAALQAQVMLPLVPSTVLFILFHCRGFRCSQLWYAPSLLSGLLV
jgi:hypothetical protein